MGFVLRRNRILLLVVIALSPLMYHVLQIERREVTPPVQTTIDPILVNRLVNLRERLRDAEFQNAARAHELISLKGQLSRVISRNNAPPASKNGTSNHLQTTVLDKSPLSLPSVYNFLPHLIDRSDALQPSLLVSRERTGVSLIFGVPTIKREKASYLLNTIGSLIEGMSQSSKDDSIILVFVGEIEDPSYCSIVAKDVQERFQFDVETGLVEIICPPASFYPDLNNIPLTFGDSKERVKWRTKQNLDFSFMMMYAQRKARYYVQLEDDILATPSFANTIKMFADQQTNNRWFMLEFSSLGFIGKLFRSTDLSILVEFFLMFHKDKPIDWLLDHILWVKVCNPEKDDKHCQREKTQLRIRFKPSQFQHVGKESSLKGKRQNLIDKDFKKAPLFQAHLNPQASAIASLEPYQTYKIDRAYTGQTFFWGLTPHPGDVIRFKFVKPVTLQKFRFKTGNYEHPGDIIRNATVEVLTVGVHEKRIAANKQAGTPEGAEKKDTIKDEYPLSDYLEIGQFLKTGIAEGTVQSHIGPIVELRLRIVSHAGENWVLLSEINMEEVKKS